MWKVTEGTGCPSGLVEGSFASETSSLDSGRQRHSRGHEKVPGSHQSPSVWPHGGSCMCIVVPTAQRPPRGPESCVFSLHLIKFPVNSRTLSIMNKWMNHPSCGFKLRRKDAEATFLKPRRMAALPKWPNAGIIISRALDFPAANSNISLKILRPFHETFPLFIGRNIFPLCSCLWQDFKYRQGRKVHHSKWGEKGECERYYFTEFSPPGQQSVCGSDYNNFAWIH